MGRGAAGAGLGAASAAQQKCAQGIEQGMDYADDVYLLLEVFVQPTDPSGPLSPSRLALCTTAVHALDPATAGALLAANAGLLECSTRGSLLEVHEHLLSLRSDELLPSFAAGSLKSACARGHLHVAEYLLRRGLLLDTLGAEGEAMLEGLGFAVLSRALGAAAAAQIEEEDAEGAGGDEGGGEGEEGSEGSTRASLIAAGSAARRASPAPPSTPLSARSSSSSSSSSSRASGTPGSGSSTAASPTRELSCRALLMAARAELDAQMVALAGLLLPSLPMTAEGPTSLSEPLQAPALPLLPISPAASLLWCIARLQCPHSPLRESDGMTPLHLAAQAGLLPELLALLAAGADANAIASDGTTPLGAVRARLKGFAAGGGRPLSPMQDALVLRLQAVHAALLEAGGRVEWRDALAARGNGSSSSSSSARHPPPGLSAVAEWGRRALELHAAKEIEDRMAAGVVVQGGGLAAGGGSWGASTSTFPALEREGGEGAAAGAAAAAAASARSALRFGGAEEAAAELYEEIFVGTADARVSLNPGDGSLTEVNAGKGGGGIFVEGGRPGRAKRAPLDGAAAPAAASQAAESLVAVGGGGGVAIRRGANAASAHEASAAHLSEGQPSDGVRTGMARSSGAFGAKFL